MWCEESGPSTSIMSMITSHAGLTGAPCGKELVSVSDEMGAGPSRRAAAGEEALTMFTRVAASRYLGIPGNTQIQGKNPVSAAFW